MKTITKTKKKADIETNHCIMQLSEKCKNKNGELPTEDFYMATSKIFNSGKMPICKHCMKEYVYNNNKNANVERFKDILRISDYPFFEALWKTSVDSRSETVGMYFKNVWFNFKDKTWKDSDVVNTLTDVELGKSDIVTTNYNDKELAKNWGNGYSIDELYWLEEYYATWKLKHDLSEIPIQRLVRRICITELKIRTAEEKNSSTEKLDKILMDLMEKASLTPKNTKDIKDNDTQRAWGLFIRDIEKYKPAEYFKDKALYEDEDGIFEYFNRFILRPMKNLLCSTRDFDKEFNIEDETLED